MAEIPYGLKKLTSGYLDEWRGIYATKEEACIAIPSITTTDGNNFRYGKFVDIGTKDNYTTYHWQGGYEDDNLVKYVELNLPYLSEDGETILNNIDPYTGEIFSKVKVTEYADGTPMDDSKVDGVIYFKNDEKLGGGYSKRVFTGSASISWFGAKGDGLTDDTSSFNQAIATLVSQQTLELEKDKKYLINGSVKKIGNWPIIEGNGSLVIQGAQQKVFNAIGAWGQIYNVSSITNELVSDGTTKLISQLTITASITDINVGDLIKIYSDDLIPESPFNSRKLGEFVTVSSITANVINLSSILKDNYTTNIRICKINKDTVEFRNLVFTVNEDVAPVSTGIGANAFIFISSMFSPKITNVEINKGFGNAIVIHSCYNANVELTDIRNLLDEPLNNYFGYGITDANSELTKVSKCYFENVRHGFTTNTYNLTSLPDYGEAASYGRSFGFIVSNSNAKGGKNAGFDTHEGASNGQFINCAHYETGYRPQQGNTDTGGFGFNIRAKNIQCVNCYVSGFGGFNIFSGNNITDTNNWSDNVQLINCTTDVYGCSVFANRFQSITVDGGKYNQVTAFSDVVIKGISSSKEGIIFKNKPVFISRSLSSNKGIIWLRNCSVKVDSIEIDRSFEVLDNNNRITNHDGNVINWSILDNTGYKCVIKSMDVINGRVPLRTFISSTDNESPKNTYVNVFVENINIFRNSGQVTISTGETINCGVITSERPNDVISSFAPTNSFYKNVNYIIDGINKEPFSSKYSLKSTSEMSSLISKCGDSEIFINIDIDSTSDLALNTFTSAKFVGQKITINNLSTTRSLTISNFTTFILLRSVLYIKPKECISLIWDGANFRPVGKMMEIITSSVGNTPTNATLNTNYGLYDKGTIVRFPNLTNGARKYTKVTDTEVDNWDVDGLNLNPISSGTFSVTGSGQTTINIPHGLGATPTFTNISPKSSAARTAGITSWTENGTNIVVTITTPNTGNTLTYSWEARL